MTLDSTSATERWSLQQQCDFISKVYGLWGGGMTVVTYAQQGEDTVVQWRYAILHNHQKGYFLEGLKKLGIDPEREPPAVVAAKYHFFSNALGGLDMEMVEESPNKAWIRYNAPFGPAGTGWLAIPPRMGRAIFAAWHPYNALRLNRPRLGFVLSKGFNDGEPYAEGYFMEYDSPRAGNFEPLRFVPKGKTIIQSTIDGADLDNEYAIDHAIVGDAKLVLRGLIDEIKGRNPKGRDGNGIIADVKAAKDAWMEEWMPHLTSNETPINPYRVIWEFMQAVDPNEAIVTHDSGSPRDQIMPFYQAGGPRTYIGWGKSHGLGTGLGLNM